VLGLRSWIWLETAAFTSGGPVSSLAGKAVGGPLVASIELYRVSAEVPPPVPTNRGAWTLRELVGLLPVQ
jgi:hypothetical protein